MSTKYFVSSYKYLSVEIVTGAEASQFKSMRFRNYCRLSCTSSSECPRAKGGRARPRGPGEDRTRMKQDSSQEPKTRTTKLIKLLQCWKNLVVEFKRHILNRVKHENSLALPMILFYLF